MSSDNVTPFRRPPPRPVRPQQSGGMGFKTHRGKAVLVHVLVLACFIVPFLIGGQLGSFVSLGIAIAAGVIAYSSRVDTTPWAATHHEQALRTLTIAFVVITLLSLPTFVMSRDWPADITMTIVSVMFWGRVIVSLWAGVRSLVGLVLASMRRAVANPTGLLI